MLNISIVLYKTDADELNNILNILGDHEIITNIILIDNSPNNDLEEIITKNKLNKIMYYFSGKNLGYGAGHNIGIRVSIKNKIKYHLIINSDITFNINEIGKLVEFIDDNDSIALVSPKIVNYQNNLQYSCKKIPKPIDLLCRLILPKAKFTEKNNFKFEMRNLNYDQIIYAPYFSGCFMLVRTKSIEDIGLFDEQFFMYPEDIDITRRLAEKFLTVYNPILTIKHEHRKASYKNIKMLIIHMYNIYKYFNKWGWIFDSKREIINEKYKKLNLINK